MAALFYVRISPIRLFAANIEEQRNLRQRIFVHRTLLPVHMRRVPVYCKRESNPSRWCICKDLRGITYAALPKFDR